MGCKWEQPRTISQLEEATANADWMEEIRPFYLRHSFPIAITLPNGSEPIFIGVLDLPHWRPTYIRVNGDKSGEVGANARTILEVGNPDSGRYSLILLNEDARLTLDHLIKRNTNVAEVDRYLFIYTLERMRFPFTTECEVKYIGPPVPDLSVRDLATSGRLGARPKPPAAQTPVVTAIIDTEIAIANERFRSGPTTTRIQHFWRQQQESMTPAKGIATGMVFDKTQIETMLKESNGDEQDFYRRLRSGDYGSRGQVPPAKGAARPPDDELVMTLWRDEVAERLKHMITLETDSVFVEGQLVRFIKNPYREDRPDYLDADLRKVINDFVFANDAETIAETIKLVDPDYLKRAEQRPREQWRQTLRDANYASRGRSRPIGFRAGHGTHIMDIAAGFPLEESLTNRPIVAVELPDYVVEDTTGARLEAFCLLAMRQILRWVDDWGAKTPGTGGRVPVVVNISLGNAAGPRNGTGFLEQELARLAEARENPATGTGVATKIVIAAGNGYRARLAGEMQLGGKRKETVDWRVPPGDKSASYLEIRADDPARLELGIVEPGGDAITIRPKMGAVLKCDRRVVGRLYSHKEANVDVLTLALAPTLALDAPYHQAPAGTYRLTFRNTGGDAMKIGLGIQRDETLSGYPLYGKQSYLDHASIDGRDPATGDLDLPGSNSPVGRENTFSSFATSTCEQMFVVGGAVASHMDGKSDAPEAPAARYTASGPTPTPRIGPDLASIAVDAPATAGQRAAGYFSGSSVVFDGTSTATAHVTRRMVDVLVQNGGAILSQKNMLKAVLGKTSLPVQHKRLGHGILSVETAPGRSTRL